MLLHQLLGCFLHGVAILSLHAASCCLRLKYQEAELDFVAWCSYSTRCFAKVHTDKAENGSVFPLNKISKCCFYQQHSFARSLNDRHLWLPFPNYTRCSISYAGTIVHCVLLIDKPGSPLTDLTKTMTRLLNAPQLLVFACYYYKQ